MPCRVVKASSRFCLATSNLACRIAAAARRYSHRTLSRGGPCAMALGASTLMSPVSLTVSLGAVLAQPRRASDTATSGNQLMTFICEKRCLAISGIFQTLLLNFSRIFPDNVGGTRIDQLERVKDIITSSGGSLCAQA